MIAQAPTGFPALRRLFRDDFPPLLRAVDPVPAQPQPDPHRPQPLQTRGDVVLRQPRRGHRGEADRSKTKTANRSTTCAWSARSTPKSCPPTRAAVSTSTATAPTARRSGPKAWPPACPSFNASQCSSGITATLEPEHGQQPGLQRTHRGRPQKSQRLLRTDQEIRLRRPVKHQLGPAPPCTQQEPLDPIYGSAARPRRTSTRSNRPANRPETLRHPTWGRGIGCELPPHSYWPLGLGK